MSPVQFAINDGRGPRPIVTPAKAGAGRRIVGIGVI